MISPVIIFTMRDGNNLIFTQREQNILFFVNYTYRGQWNEHIRFCKLIIRQKLVANTSCRYISLRIHCTVGNWVSVGWICDSMLGGVDNYTIFEFWSKSWGNCSLAYLNHPVLEVAAVIRCRPVKVFTNSDFTNWLPLYLTTSQKQVFFNLLSWSLWNVGEWDKLHASMWSPGTIKHMSTSLPFSDPPVETISFIQRRKSSQPEKFQRITYEPRNSRVN